jgi:hypothetical protein
MALDIDGTAQITGTSGTSANVTLTTAITNDIIIAAVKANDFAPSGVPTSAHLTFTHRVSINIGGTQPWTSSAGIGLWYAKAAGTLSSEVITVAFGGTSGFIDIFAFGISGADQTTIFDTDGSLPGANSVANSDITVTTSNAIDILLSLYGFSSTSDPTAGAGGWVQIGTSSGGFFLVQYKLVSATQSGADVPIGTGTGNNNQAIIDAVMQSTSAVAQTKDQRGNFDVQARVNRGSASRVTHWTRNASRIFLPARELWTPPPLIGAFA